MGQYQYNATLLCDYATPENYSAFELHMELPIPYQDFAKIQNWLFAGDWQPAQQYLINKYPQHSEILSQWCAGSRKRKEGKADTVRDRMAA